MRKRPITPTTETVRSRDESWLDLERAAVVEVTSEDDDSLFLKSAKLPVHRSSFCDGLRMAGRRSAKLYASSGISVHLRRYARTKEYQVELSNVTLLELIIVPNMSGGAARASLKNLRLS
jgi:hypothetical protein